MYKLGDVVVGRDEIRKKAVLGLAARINEDYAGKEVTVIGVLKGAMIFLSDLVRELEMPVCIDFIVVSSYGVETETSGVVLLVKDIDSDIEGKHVLIVEDMIDTGVTLKYLKELFESRKPATLKVCAAFDKPERRKVDLSADYAGIRLADDFVVGYGLDFANMYRNLPDLRALAEDSGAKE
ncbi:MAG: hypoxanthine phosphoribosyltransferase [Clostridiales bacterium]|jgi:hypoxanthine phosphoribosyltransferase|nr:hypoxanthine phosphoribosyltransferase [Clostridiales bacterium]